MKQLVRISLITALLLFGIASTFTATQPARATGPQRLWHGEITMQNVPGGILVQTLFTPPVTGQYELKLYSTIAQPDATSDALWNVGLQFYDGAGTEQAPALQQLKSANAYPNAWGSANGAGGQPGSVSTFVTAKDTQVVLDIVKSHSDLAIARIYWTAELLQPMQTF